MYTTVLYNIIYQSDIHNVSHPPGSEVVNMSQLSFTIEVLLGIVSGQSNVGWNGAQQLYNVCNVIWNGERATTLCNNS